MAGPEAQKNYTLEIAPNDEAILSTDELKNLLEPGMSPPDIIDKEAELDFIRNHKSFPEPFKNEFIEFLEKRPELFSGEEFSQKCFPEEFYSHDVELIEEVPHMSARPFPVSGIRLQQLKADNGELVKNGILSPGDSPVTSPVFLCFKEGRRRKDRLQRSSLL